MANMEDRSERAVQLFKDGAGCAQAVVAAYADLVGLDFGTAMKVSCALSGGVSRLREVCGAVSGMAVIAGMLEGNTEPADIESRTQAYERVQKMSGLFREKFGTVVCRDLLGKTDFEKTPSPTLRDSAFYDSRPCVDCIRFAAQTIAQCDFPKSGS